jgi:predicted nucleic acid-binding Zn ribbon protein
LKEEAFLGELLEGYLRDIGRKDVLDVSAILHKWKEIVGEQLSQRSIPTALEGAKLEILTPAPVWSSEIHMKSASIIRRIEEETGIKIEEIRVNIEKERKNPCKGD